jgi:uncharacterized membrane protein
VTRTTILFASLLFVALAAGGAYVVSFNYYPSGMSSAFYVETMQHGIRTIGPPLFVALNLGMLFTIVSAFLARRDRPRFYLLIAASICIIAVAAITVFGNIPINNQIETWSINSPPSNWAALREKWWRFHITRAVILITGLSLLILAALVRRDTSK